MEQHQCPACGKTFDTGALLLDTYLRNRFDKNTVTGSSLCSDCNKRIVDGFTILIVIKDGESGDNPYRTGEMLYWKSADSNNKPDTPIMYIEESTANELKVQYEKA